MLILKLKRANMHSCERICMSSLFLLYILYLYNWVGNFFSCPLLLLLLHSIACNCISTNFVWVELHSVRVCVFNVQPITMNARSLIYQTGMTLLMSSSWMYACIHAIHIIIRLYSLARIKYRAIHLISMKSG